MEVPETAGLSVVAVPLLAWAWTERAATTEERKMVEKRMVAVD